ncbi:MAG: hypothetical protein RLZZ480_359 [Candidatus Parcubacteria bacterium]|jgi:hypothetical protein
MAGDLSDEMLKFCDKELEHLRLEQEFALHDLSEYRDEKLKDGELLKSDTV